MGSAIGFGAAHESSQSTERSMRGAALLDSLDASSSEGEALPMGRLARLILVRHGETAGQSSIRYYGATDVPLSELGRAQAHEARGKIPGETYESVWASSLSRAWESAQIIAPGRSIRIESDLCEIDFGRWEGLTREEIERAEPELHAVWQSRAADFEFPEGETRARFRGRIEAGLARLRESGVRSALVVAHKGVVRTLLELVSEQTLAPESPELGGVIHVYRNLDGQWQTGRRGSDPSCSEAPVGLPISEG